MARPAVAFDMTDEPGEFEEAVEAFSTRTIISRETADTLEGYARNRSFWISGVAQMDIVNDAHASLLEAIRNGTPFSKWKKEIGPSLAKAWGGTDSHRLRVIFNNATAQSYNAGRWREMHQPHVRAMRPYAEFDGINDSRQTDICANCDGTRLPVGDPWWLTHSPQLHHLCRSAIRTQRSSVAESKGITQTPTSQMAEDGWGNPPNITEPPKPVERKSPPDPVIHREAYAKKAKDESKRKPRAIPAKSVTDNADAELFGKFRRAPNGTPREELNELANQRAIDVASLPEKLNRKRAKELIVATGADVPVEVAMEFPRLVAALGDKFHVYDWNDEDERVALHGEVHNLAKMDPGLIARIVHYRRADTIPEFDGVFVGARKLTEMDGMTKFAGVVPKGWEGHGTWDNIGGAGSSSECIVSVTGGGFSASAIRHEFGHVIGAREIVWVSEDLVRRVNDSPDLVRFHEQFFDRLTDYFKQDGPGGSKGRKEMLAESIAELYSYPSDRFDHNYSREYREWLNKILERQ